MSCVLWLSWTPVDGHWPSFCYGRLIGKRFRALHSWIASAHLHPCHRQESTSDEFLICWAAVANRRWIPSMRYTRAFSELDGPDASLVRSTSWQSSNQSIAGLRHSWGLRVPVHLHGAMASRFLRSCWLSAVTLLAYSFFRRYSGRRTSCARCVEIIRHK